MPFLHHYENPISDGETFFLGLLVLYLPDSVKPQISQDLCPCPELIQTPSPKTVSALPQNSTSVSFHLSVISLIFHPINILVTDFIYTWHHCSYTGYITGCGVKSHSLWVSLNNASNKLLIVSLSSFIRVVFSIHLRFRSSKSFNSQLLDNYSVSQITFYFF